MLTALLVEFIARRQSKTTPFSRATLNFHRFSATANGAEIGTHRASGNGRGARANRAQTSRNRKSAMAGTVFTRHPASTGISRRHHRALYRQDDLGPLSQRSFPRTALRQLAQLVSGC